MDQSRFQATNDGTFPDGVEPGGSHDDEIGDDYFSFDDGSSEGSGGDTVEPPRVPPRLGLLATLSSAEFDVVARSAKLNFFEAGKVVFHQGDDADRFFILVDGSVEIQRDGQLLATLEPGSFFGESALMIGGKRSATVSTVAESALWSVGYLAFEQVVSGHLMANDEARDEVQARLDKAPPGAFD